MKNLFIIALIALFSALSTSACSGTDTSPADAAGRADAALGQETRCGETLTCATATEMCVVMSGIVPNYACVPVPTECESDRTCACAALIMCGERITCTDVEPNHIECCPKC